PPPHDAAHLARVVVNARRLADAEECSGRPANRTIIELAAWLHDVVMLPKGQAAPGEAARRSADEARSILTALGVDQATIHGVCHAVLVHSFSGGLTPETPEARIVQDADRLDALGAIGIARLWVTGAEMHSLLYHPTNPAGVDRELDDRVWALDHIERKLLKLPEMMQTEAGRVEAERRAAYVRDHRAQILSEIGSDRDAAGAVDRVRRA
ncbi:MAG: HD domain-containing protein, partial [Thermomicrobiales bacterium]|nr:HD domain-containing protein [Thermomicrobiales bacterium]